MSVQALQCSCSLAALAWVVPAALGCTQPKPDEEPAPPAPARAEAVARVVRGAADYSCCGGLDTTCRAAARGGQAPGVALASMGARCARDVAEPPQSRKRYQSAPMLLEPPLVSCCGARLPSSQMRQRFSELNVEDRRRRGVS